MKKPHFMKRFGRGAKKLKKFERILKLVLRILLMLYGILRILF